MISPAVATYDLVVCLSMPTTISVHSPLLASSNKFICDSLHAIFHTYFDIHPHSLGLNSGLSQLRLLLSYTHDISRMGLCIHEWTMQLVFLREA